MNPLTSRKFILSALALLSATWALWEGLLTSADYKAALLGIVGVYVTGNVAQKATAKDGSQS